MTPRYVTPRYVRKIENLISYEHVNSIDHEQPYVVVSKEFARAYKSLLNDLLKGTTYEVAKMNPGYCEVSAFIKDTTSGRYAYISTADFRFFKDEWRDNILVRSAKSIVDYTGGSNGYASVYTLVQKLDMLFE